MDKQPLHDIISPSNSPKRNPASTGVRRPQSPQTRRNAVPRKRKSSFGILLILIILLSMVAFAFSFLFSGATVVVTPRQESVFIDGTFIAGEGTLPFTIMKIEEALSDTVKATEKEYVEKRASGRVVVYNNYNTTSHSWIKNTRFETPDGLVYRVRKSVVIPGMKTVNGKKIPGSIEIAVTADEPGEKYNIGLTDFTIPGLKGGAKYESFYARSMTAMTGGFVGTKLIVSDQVLTETRSTLQTTLKEKLRSLAEAQKPEQFLMFGTGVAEEFESSPTVDQKNFVTIEERGTLYAVLFDEEAFAGYLANSTMAEYDENAVRINNLGELDVLFNQEHGDLWKTDEITFSVNGTANFEWLYDSNDLKIDLLGQSKDAIYSILSSYPGIQEAEATIRPFWHITFPSKSEKIKIEKK